MIGIGNVGLHGAHSGKRQLISPDRDPVRPLADIAAGTFEVGPLPVNERSKRAAHCAPVELAGYRAGCDGVDVTGRRSHCEGYLVWNLSWCDQSFEF